MAFWRSDTPAQPPSCSDSRCLPALALSRSGIWPAPELKISGLRPLWYLVVMALSFTLSLVFAALLRVPSCISRRRAPWCKAQQHPNVSRCLPSAAPASVQRSVCPALRLSSAWQLRPSDALGHSCAPPLRRLLSSTLGPSGARSKRPNREQLECWSDQAVEHLSC